MEKNLPLIYMDNAATSWPKPPEVMDAMREAVERCGGNPGRGGHRLAVAAGELLYETRDRVAEFFGCEDAFRVSFTLNITMAVNMVLRGFLHPGDHVLVSPMEHNAVMRPLNALGIAYDILAAEPDGRIDLNRMAEKLRPETKLLCVCHESNVNGVIQPLRKLGAFAREHGLYLLADCAQSAGSLQISLEEDAIDFLCFTGHKGLLGPTGTGGVVFGSRVDPRTITPLTYGGTGSLSESFEQPFFLPDHLESGTQNVTGLAGLNAGIRWLQHQNAAALGEESSRLMRRLRKGLESIPGVHLYGAADPARQGCVLSLTKENVDNGEAAAKLDRDYGIMTRVGLHCAPLAHRTLGTFPCGTIRFGISPFTTEEQIDRCIAACRTL